MQWSAEPRETIGRGELRIHVLLQFDTRAARAEVEHALMEAGEAMVSHELTPGLLSPGAPQGRALEQLTTR